MDGEVAGRMYERIGDSVEGSVRLDNNWPEECAKEAVGGLIRAGFEGIVSRRV